MSTRKTNVASHGVDGAYRRDTNLAGLGLRAVFFRLESEQALCCSCRIAFFIESNERALCARY